MVKFVSFVLILHKEIKKASKNFNFVTNHLMMILCCGKESNFLVAFEVSLHKVLGDSVGINYDHERFIPKEAAEVLRRLRRFLF